MSDLLPKLKSIVLFVIIFIVANFLAGLGAGILAGFGGNVALIGLNSLSFDPLITIAYIVLFHYVSHYLELPRSAAYPTFLFTLFLSFAMNFIQGSLLLILLLTLLKRFRVISS